MAPLHPSRQAIDARFPSGPGGRTLSLNDAAPKPRSHRSGPTADQMESNSVLFSRTELARRMNISGKRVDGRSDMSWRILGLCCVAANPSVHGNDGRERATGTSRDSAATSSRCIESEHLSELCIPPRVSERNPIGPVSASLMKPDMRRMPNTPRPSEA